MSHRDDVSHSPFSLSGLLSTLVTVVAAVALVRQRRRRPAVPEGHEPRVFPGRSVMEAQVRDLGQGREPDPEPGTDPAPRPGTEPGPGTTTGDGTGIEDRPVPPQDDDRPPSSPLQLDAPDWKQSVRRTLKELKADRGGLVAAGMAFYWFLAVFPALIAAVGILGLLHVGADVTASITGGLTRAMPGDAAELLANAVTRAGGAAGGASVVAAAAGVAVAVWSASAGMVAMQAGLDVAYDVDHDRPFLTKRLVALALLGATVVLGGVATALIVFGQPLGEALRQHLPFGTAFVVVWTVVRWVAAVGAVVVLFAVFYALAPNRHPPRFVWVSPGGLVGVAIWLGASLGFSLYVSSFGSYARTYGSLTGVVVLVLWLYLSALAVVLGGELNAELERQAAVRKGQLPGPPRRR